MKKNQGISLISLIITIIVIIILAGITIFRGTGTLGKTQLADFVSQVSSLADAVQDKYSSLFTDYALDGDSRTEEQIYFQIATGIDGGEGTYMNGFTTSVAESDGKDYQNIVNNDEAEKEEDKNVGTRIGMSLPKVRGKVDGWCITKNGQIFNASGFYDEGSGRTYFTANLYVDSQLASSSDTTTLANRAETISRTILAGEKGEIEGLSD